MRGQLHGANGFLHQAIALAHQSNNTQAIIYTYSLVKALTISQDVFNLFKCASNPVLLAYTVNLWEHVVD